MPISTTSAFSDSRDFQAALRRCGIVRLVSAHSTGFRARLTQIGLNRLALLAASENTSRLATVSMPRDQTLIAFLHADEGEHYWDERRLSLGELVFVSGLVRRKWRTRSPTRWGAVVLPNATLADCVRTITGKHAPMLPADLTLWRPKPPAFRELLKLHRAVVHCTVRQPEAPVGIESARGVEQELLTALVEAIADATKTE